jgi:hypothetical protein
VGRLHGLQRPTATSSTSQRATSVWDFVGNDGASGDDGVSSWRLRRPGDVDAMWRLAVVWRRCGVQLCWGHVDVPIRPPELFFSEFEFGAC